MPFCILNEMADGRAETGADWIYYWPNKYGSLQLHIKAASLQAQVTEDKLNVSLPDFGAPNNQILRQTIRAYLLRSPKPWNAVFKILLWSQ